MNAGQKNTMIRKIGTRSPRRARVAGRGAPNSDDNGANIRVVVRVRPHNQHELGNNAKSVISVASTNVLTFDPKENAEPFFYHGVQQRRDISKKVNKNMQFLFDRVFAHDSNNGDVFEDSTKDLIATLMDGYNCSVFVYGATGAGKTFTMLGNSEHPGISFLTMSELFKKKNELSEERDFELGITYLEVYNENVHDLLNPGKALHLRDDGKFGVIVAGISVKRIQEPQELFELLEKGNKNRTQHPTDANAESSRSHAVFQVYMRMTIKTTGEVITTKLSMIDLAGSERGSATGCGGARFTEGANINKSLLALGNCINSLADGHKHIPYRDSKLTRILKDSLGGNCRTVMIANVAPSCLNYEDTYNTLKYAMRAKKIKSRMKKNVMNCELNIADYAKLVQELQKKNEELLSRLQQQPETTAVHAEPVIDKRQQEQLEEAYRKLKSLEERIGNLESTAQFLELKRVLKEKEDERLSGLCTETPQKETGHKRFGKTMDRLQKHKELIDEEVAGLKVQKDKVVEEIEELKKVPGLEVFVKIEELELKNIQAELKAACWKKMMDFHKQELDTERQLLDEITQFTQPCFMQLRGLGLATDVSIQKYQKLMSNIQGLRSVAFSEDGICDSGVSSTTTTQDEHKNEEPKPEEPPKLKRKLPENETNANPLLENTFVLTPSKTRKPSKVVTVCAENLMAKVYKPSFAKKSFKLKPKENVEPLRSKLITKKFAPKPGKPKVDSTPHFRP